MISVATACWGDYWERFGKDFVESMEKANPAEVVIVTDQQISVPSSWIIKRPVSSIRMWDWFNEAVEHCTSEWVFMANFDATYFEDALRSVDLDSDIVFIGMLQNGESHSFHSVEHWNEFLHPSTIPGWMPYLCRTELWISYPWRKVVYPDWMQLIEFRYHTLTIAIDRTPRFEHKIHKTNHSGISWHAQIGQNQVRFMQNALQSGAVVPGPEWPPQGSAFSAAPVISPTIRRLMDMRQKRKKR